MLFVLSNNVFGEGEFHLTSDIAVYIKNYDYDEKYEARLSNLICDCMERFSVLGNLIEKQGFSETGSEGILIANYSLAFQTMDVYSFTKVTTTIADIKYVGKVNSYGIEDIQKIQSNYQFVSYAISHFLQNDRVTVNDINNVSDAGCYYIYVYRNGQSKSWLAPVNIFPDPGILEETFFDPALDVIINTQ